MNTKPNLREGSWIQLNTTRAAAPSMLLLLAVTVGTQACFVVVGPERGWHHGWR